MRWYCVSPALPKGAQLRVRTSPSASSPESTGYRLNIHDVVTAASPPLKAPWLHVSWQHSDGYVMASTPDDMPLLVPWESTTLAKVVFVYPETQLRHQSTNETVLLEHDAYLGVLTELVSGDDDDDVSYVVMYQGEPYIVEQEDVVVMAERIHASMQFSLNPDLPDNATVVVRQWPQRDSDQVDVLTHGQAIAGEIRSEDWIKIHEHAWVMWKMASHNNLELLQPVRPRSDHDQDSDAEVDLATGDALATEDRAPESLAMPNRGGSTESRQCSLLSDNRAIAAPPPDDDRPIRQAKPNTLPNLVDADPPISTVATVPRHAIERRPALPTPSSAVHEEDRPIHPVQSSMELDRRCIHPAASDAVHDCDRPIPSMIKSAIDHHVLGPAALNGAHSSAQDRPNRSGPSQHCLNELHVDEGEGFAGGRRDASDDRPMHRTTPRAWHDRPSPPRNDYPVRTAVARTFHDEMPLPPAVDERRLHVAVSPAMEMPVRATVTADRPRHPAQPSDAAASSVLDEPVHLAWPHAVGEDQSIQAAIPTNSAADQPIHPATTAATNGHATAANCRSMPCDGPLAGPMAIHSRDDPPMPTFFDHDSLADRPTRPIRFDNVSDNVSVLAASTTDGDAFKVAAALSNNNDPPVMPHDALSVLGDDAPIDLSKLQQLARDLSDVHVMWPLQIELLDALHPLVLDGISSQVSASLTTDDHAAVCAMLEAKLQASLHAKVVPVFLQLAVPYLSSTAQRPPTSLLPGLLRLFQVKAAQARLEPFLAGFLGRFPMDEVWTAFEQVLVVNSDDERVAPLTEMGAARLLVWWSVTMCPIPAPPSTDDWTYPSLRLCDALAPYASHRATKVRVAAVDILAFLVHHHSTGRDAAPPSHLDQWLSLQSDPAVQEAVRRRMQSTDSRPMNEGQPPSVVAAPVVGSDKSLEEPRCLSSGNPPSSTDDSDKGNGVATLLKRSSTTPQRKAKERFAQWKQDRLDNEAPHDPTFDESIVVGDRFNGGGHVVSFAQWKHHDDGCGPAAEQALQAKCTPRDKAKSKFAQWKCQQQQQGTSTAACPTSDVAGTPPKHDDGAELPRAREAASLDTPATIDAQPTRQHSQEPATDFRHDRDRTIEAEPSARHDLRESCTERAVATSDSSDLGDRDLAAPVDSDDFLEPSHDIVARVDRVVVPVAPSPIDGVNKSKCAQSRRDNSVEVGDEASPMARTVDLVLPGEPADAPVESPRHVDDPDGALIDGDVIPRRHAIDGRNEVADDDDIGSDSVEEVDENDAYLTSTSPRCRMDGPVHTADPREDDVEAVDAPSRAEDACDVARAMYFSDVSDDDDDDIALLGHHSDDQLDAVDEYAILHQELLDTHVQLHDAGRDGAVSDEFHEEFPDVDLWCVDHLFMPDRNVDAELARLQRTWSGDARGYWDAVLESSPAIVLAATFPNDRHDQVVSWLANESMPEEELTTTDKDAIAEYRARWEAARQAVLKDVMPPAHAVLRQIPTPIASSPSDAKKINTPTRLLQRSVSSRTLQRPSSLASMTSPGLATSSSLRAPSSMPSKVVPRTTSAMAPSTPISGIPATSSTPTRHSSMMRPPTVRTPLGPSRLHTPSSRPLSIPRESIH